MDSQLALKEKKLEFSKKGIELAIVDYYNLDFVEYREDQADIVRYIAKLLQKRIVINDLAIQGFIMRAIRKWQQDKEIKVGQLLKKKPKERIANVRIMFDNLRAELKSVLINTRGEDLLDEAIEEAFQAYVDEFSQRKSRLY